MKTMYRLDYNTIEDKTIGNTYYNTIEEAIDTYPMNESNKGFFDGRWFVVARTIDEETFTVVDTIVKDNVEEVEKAETERRIKKWEEYVNDLKNDLLNTKNKKTIKRLQDEINYWTMKLKQLEKERGR